jgi:hypothetical protein
MSEVPDSRGRVLRVDEDREIEAAMLVPVLDQFPILHAPYIDASHLDRRTVGLMAHECLTEGSVAQ